MFVDYVCTTLCGTVAGVLADASDDASLQAGKDYAVVLIGLRTGRDAATEAAFRAHALGGSKLAHVAFLASADSGDDLARLLSAAGITAHYDPMKDQFAHPAVVFAIDPRGRVSAALDALSLTTGELSNALAGRPSDTLSARILSVCSGFQAALGVRSAAAMAVLSAASIAFMLALALMIFWQARISSRSGSSGERR
jgi:protein SCO1/2